jgi:hypothetical protein
MMGDINLGRLNLHVLEKDNGPAPAGSRMHPSTTPTTPAPTPSYRRDGQLESLVEMLTSEKRCLWNEGREIP